MGIEGLALQNVDVVFTQGLDTKSDEKLVVPGKWVELENYSLSEKGSLVRRNGIANFTTQNGNGLATHNNELLLVNGTTVRSASTAGNTTFLRDGQIGYVKVGKSEVYRSSNTQDGADCAFGNGYICYAWIEKDPTGTILGAMVTVEDATTGTLVMGATTLSSVGLETVVRVVFADNAFFIFEMIGTGGLYCTVIETSVPSTKGSLTLLDNDPSIVKTGTGLDACAFGLIGQNVLLGYAYNDGTTSVMGAIVSRAALSPTIAFGPAALITEVDLPAANLQGIAVVAFTSQIGGIFTRATDTGAPTLQGTAGITVDDTLTPISGPTQLDSTAGVASGPAGELLVHICGCLNGADVQLFYDQRNAWGLSANTVYPIRTVTVDQTLSVTSAARDFINSAAFDVTNDLASPQGPWIAGKPFAQNSTNVVLPVCVQENYVSFITKNQQNTLFFVDGFSGVIVGKALYGSYGTSVVNEAFPTVYTPTSSPEIETGRFITVAQEKTIPQIIATGVNITPTGLVRINLTPNTRDALSADQSPPIRTQLGESTYFSGGQLCNYDGLQVTEHGFPLFPEGISAVLVAGTLADGQYQLVCIYEWVDNSGQRHQSAPSLPVSITTSGGNDGIRLSCPSLLISQKTNVRLVVYMTQVNGTVFNRYTTTALGDGSIANNTAVKFSTFADITSATDVAAIASNELLYTQPGTAGTVLPNIAPGPCNVITKHQNRLFVDAADDPFAYRFSQPYTNNVGLEFNPSLGGRVDNGSGGITGLASMDEKLIIFCRNQLYTVLGTGPQLSGSYSNYSDPQEIQSDVGCVEARSILEVPNGIIFKSGKGFYLLGRDLSVNYIGAGVQAYNSNDVCAAVMVENKQEARFYSRSGTILVYAYLVGEWSTYKYSSYQETYLPFDAIYWRTRDTVFTASASDGMNYDTGSYTDAPGNQTPVGITCRGRTGFLRLDKIGGYQRVKRVYLTMGSGDGQPPLQNAITINVYYDDTYSTALPTSSYQVGSGVYAGPVYASGQSFDIRHRLKRQKCKSVAFEFINGIIEDTDTNYSGLNMQAMTLEIGVKRGTNKLRQILTLGTGT